MTTLAFQSTAYAGIPYLLILHTAAAPELQEWQAYVDVVAAAMSNSSAMLYSFVITDGGGPSSRQRKDLADAYTLGNGKANTHVFTTSTLVRGIVTAFHWMNWTPTEAHHPLEFAAVCARCQLPPSVILTGFCQLQNQLPSVAILNGIEASVRVFSLKQEASRPAP
ncbi:MAG: hypothetical protein RL701_2820 [Pseudomonadota bacterium]